MGAGNGKRHLALLACAGCFGAALAGVYIALPQLLPASIRSEVVDAQIAFRNGITGLFGLGEWRGGSDLTGQRITLAFIVVLALGIAAFLLRTRAAP